MGYTNSTVSVAGVVLLCAVCVCAPWCLDSTPATQAPRPVYPPLRVDPTKREAADVSVVAGEQANAPTDVHRAAVLGGISHRVNEGTTRALAPEMRPVRELILPIDRVVSGVERVCHVLWTRFDFADPAEIIHWALLAVSSGHEQHQRQHRRQRRQD